MDLSQYEDLLSVTKSIPSAFDDSLSYYETLSKLKYVINTVNTEIEQMKLDYETKTDLKDTRKLDEKGNFTGSWFGIKSPTYAEPGIAAVVDGLNETIKERGVSILLYGAKGDGITDDTTAFTNALASGNDIFIPKGTYIISQTLNLVNKGQKMFGRNLFNTIIKPSNSFTGEALLKMDGTNCPANRSMQLIENFMLDGDYRVQCLSINKNADFDVNKIRMYHGTINLYLKDTLLYNFNTCRIENGITGIYFYGASTLSANNNCTFYNCKMIGNTKLIDQRLNTNVGGDIIFEKCEIEQNGILNNDTDTIYMEGSNITQNMVTFRDCWIEGNHNKRTFHFKMGLQNTVNFDNCRMLTNANEVDYMIIAEPLDTTYNGSGCCIEIHNCYDPSTYLQNTIKTTGNIIVQALNFYYGSINIENIDESFIKRSTRRFITNLNFENGKGINMYSPSGTGYNKVYSKSANALNLESELGFIDIKPSTNQYWGCSAATDYSRPLRIGNLWLWQNSNNLYMKYGAAQPTNNTDGTIIGTA